MSMTKLAHLSDSELITCFFGQNWEVLMHGGFLLQLYSDSFDNNVWKLVGKSLFRWVYLELFFMTWLNDLICRDLINIWCVEMGLYNISDLKPHSKRDWWGRRVVELVNLGWWKGTLIGWWGLVYWVHYHAEIVKRKHVITMIIMFQHQIMGKSKSMRTIRLQIFSVH